MISLFLHVPCTFATVLVGFGWLSGATQGDSHHYVCSSNGSDIWCELGPTNPRVNTSTNTNISTSVQCELNNVCKCNFHYCILHFIMAPRVAVFPLSKPYVVRINDDEHILGSQLPVPASSSTALLCYCGCNDDGWLGVFGWTDHIPCNVNRY